MLHTYTYIDIYIYIGIYTYIYIYTDLQQALEQRVLKPPKDPEAIETSRVYINHEACANLPKLAEFGIQRPNDVLDIAVRRH